MIPETLKRCGARGRGERPRRAVQWAGAALAALLGCGIAAAAPSAVIPPQSADAQLDRVIGDVRNGSLTKAMRDVDRLIARYPNFRLAYLVRGDLLLAHARPITGLGDVSFGPKGRLAGLRAEALARVRAEYDVPPDNLVPRYLLKLDSQQKDAIVVDAALSRVYVYAKEHGALHLVRDFYSTLGKDGVGKQRESDKKTPVGVYRVTSWLPGRKLPDLYGAGAFPINYPNARDRLLGRTGHGIWIHGVPPDTYARAPRASDGCIALANPDLRTLEHYVRPGTTPVVIAPRVVWVTRKVLHADRDAFLAVLNAWRLAWQSNDVERYLSYYASSFRTSDHDLAWWKAHKRRVSAQKTWIKVRLDNVSVFRDPGAKNLISVSFDQYYRSNNYDQHTRKDQYWKREAGRWKIIYEAPAHAPVLALPESFPGSIRASGQGANPS